MISSLRRYATRVSGGDLAAVRGETKEVTMGKNIQFKYQEAEQARDTAFRAAVKELESDFEKEPHSPQCWRNRNHWQCAVALVEEMAAALRKQTDDLKDVSDLDDRMCSMIAEADWLLARVCSDEEESDADCD